MQQLAIPAKIGTCVLILERKHMSTRTLDIYQINNKRYVTPRGAANYLDITDDLLQNDIYTGKLKADFIASRQMIELDSLRAYTENRRRSARGWDRVEQFLSSKKVG